MFEMGSDVKHGTSLKQSTACNAHFQLKNMLIIMRISLFGHAQLTNVQSTKSEAAVTVRKKSVSCFTPTCVNTLNACL